MKDKDLSQNLWQITNLLTGFAVVQAIAFTYACADTEFSEMINTPLAKMTIAVHIIIVTVAECYAVWWCAKKAEGLLENERQAGGAEDVKHRMITRVTRQVAWGRIAVILSLLVPVLLSLYAEQLSSVT